MDGWANVIENDGGVPLLRMVALATTAGARFDRLAASTRSRLLIGLLSGEGGNDGIDPGVDWSKVASSGMDAHATKGMRLELKGGGRARCPRYGRRNTRILFLVGRNQARLSGDAQFRVIRS